MTDEKPVEVFISQNTGEARLVCQLLISRGLDAVILDAYASGSVGGFGPAIPSRVVVPPAQARAALEIIAGAAG
jgi:hypothetical protein